MLIFGGEDDNGLRHDLWALSFCPGTAQWTEIATTNAPPSVEYHKAVFDSAGDRMLVYFGDANGDAIDGKMDTVWALPFAGPNAYQWSRLMTSSRPCRRSGESAVIDPTGSRVLVFGGRDKDFERQDTWAFDLTTNAWSKVNPTDTTSCFYAFCPLKATCWAGHEPCACPSRDVGRTNLPTLIHQHAAVYDTPHSRMLVIGGWYEETNEAYPELWALTGSSWSKVQSNMAPGGLFYHTAVVDPGRHRAIVFDGTTETGVGPGAPLDSTWELDLNNDTWTAMAYSGPRPEARIAHSAVFDQAGDRMVVFGGENGSGSVLDDAWVLNFGDTTAPAAVADLDFKRFGSNYVVLRWSAPGDDGASGGNACRYSVRWSTSPITEANFSSATVVSGAPAPSSSGSTDSVMVSSLPQNTWLYFGIKTNDEGWNTSTLSNVPCIKLGSPYQICEGGGEFGRPVSETEPGIDLQLERVGPNPNHGSLNVSFTLGHEGPARIEVLDLAGRRVVVREVGSFGVGSHSIEIGAAAGLKPGYYVLRLVQGDRSLQRSAVVVR